MIATRLETTVRVTRIASMTLSRCQCFQGTIVTAAARPPTARKEAVELDAAWTCKRIMAAGSEIAGFGFELWTSVMGALPRDSIQPSSTLP